MLIVKAMEFAQNAHNAIDQRRKYTNEPYIVHPAAVARLVSSVTEDIAMICAAWLHDVVEDTKVTLNQLEVEFGEDIATLVAELTNLSGNMDSARQERKAVDYHHTARASSRAKTIKLADIIDNVSTIVEHDPTFAKVYIAEKRALLEVLTEGDAELYEQAEALVSTLASEYC
ncbi:HD domain-containing protein [Halioxenophilus sp. WMMB6]|uniref:HD domain-containing protein n=1 Tax=Halioxenophilus sp. WMMB6 TaxID=3073815 RepID=UPI00295F1C11|nr:HD domain-containing protein [Halioxenophilus sp. WMMB6]